MKNETNEIDKKSERRKLTGIGLIMLLLILYALSLWLKVVDKEPQNVQKQERVEKTIKQLEDEFTR